MDPTLKIAGAISVLAAGVAGLCYLARGLWRGTKTLHQLADALLGDKAAGKPSLVDQVVAIKRELHPNGGSSMRDALDATRATVVRVERRQERVEQRLDALEAAHRTERV